MKNAKALVDLGTNATYFGLGLLAAKKLRPYAKYFIAGGIVLAAVPGVLTATQQLKAKKAGCGGQTEVEEAQVDEMPATEVAEEEEAGCGCAEATEPCGQAEGNAAETADVNEAACCGQEQPEF